MLVGGLGRGLEYDMVRMMGCAFLLSGSLGHLRVSDFVIAGVVWRWGQGGYGSVYTTVVTRGIRTLFFLVHLGLSALAYVQGFQARCVQALDGLGDCSSGFRPRVPCYCLEKLSCLVRGRYGLVCCEFMLSGCVPGNKNHGRRLEAPMRSIEQRLRSSMAQVHVSAGLVQYEDETAADTFGFPTDGSQSSRCSLERIVRQHVQCYEIIFLAAIKRRMNLQRVCAVLSK